MGGASLGRKSVTTIYPPPPFFLNYMYYPTMNIGGASMVDYGIPTVDYGNRPNRYMYVGDRSDVHVHYSLHRVHHNISLK